MSRSLQQQAEAHAGRKPDGDVGTMESNAATIQKLADELGQQAERMKKTHMDLEGPVIERANARADERYRNLKRRSEQLGELAARLKGYAADLKADLTDWNNRVNRELQRLQAAG